MDLTEVLWGGAYLIIKAQDWDQLRAVVNTELKLRI